MFTQLKWYHLSQLSQATISSLRRIWSLTLTVNWDHNVLTVCSLHMRPYSLVLPVWLSSFVSLEVEVGLQNVLSAATKAEYGYKMKEIGVTYLCLLYTSDAADE